MDVDLSTVWSLLLSLSFFPSLFLFLSLSLCLLLSFFTHTLIHTLTLVGISNLEQLEYLDVSSNQLSRLRAGLKDLTTLQTFIVTDNPLESPPMQVRT